MCAAGAAGGRAAFGFSGGAVLGVDPEGSQGAVVAEPPRGPWGGAVRGVACVRGGRQVLALHEGGLLRSLDWGSRATPGKLAADASFQLGLPGPGLALAAAPAPDAGWIWAAAACGGPGGLTEGGSVFLLRLRTSKGEETSEVVARADFPPGTSLPGPAGIACAAGELVVTLAPAGARGGAGLAAWSLVAGHAELQPVALPRPTAALPEIGGSPEHWEVLGAVQSWEDGPAGVLLGASGAGSPGAEGGAARLLAAPVLSPERCGPFALAGLLLSAGDPRSGEALEWALQGRPGGEAAEAAAAEAAALEGGGGAAIAEARARAAVEAAASAAAPRNAAWMGALDAARARAAAASLRRPAVPPGIDGVARRALDRAHLAVRSLGVGRAAEGGALSSGRRRAQERARHHAVGYMLAASVTLGDSGCAEPGELEGDDGLGSGHAGASAAALALERASDPAGAAMAAVVALPAPAPGEASSREGAEESSRSRALAALSARYGMAGQWRAGYTSALAAGGASTARALRGLAHAASAGPIVGADAGGLAAVAALPLAGIRGGETLVTTLARALLRRADRGSVPHSGLGPYAAPAAVLVNRSRWRGASAAAKRCADRQAAELSVPGAAALRFAASAAALVSGPAAPEQVKRIAVHASTAEAATEVGLSGSNGNAAVLSDLARLSRAVAEDDGNQWKRSAARSIWLAEGGLTPPGKGLGLAEVLRKSVSVALESGAGAAQVAEVAAALAAGASAVQLKGNSDVAAVLWRALQTCCKAAAATGPAEGAHIRAAAHSALSGGVQPPAWLE